MSETWLPNEMRLINSVEIFQLKPFIMKKAEGYLWAIRDAMIPELTSGIYPEGTDLINGQLVRGENHKGFPFLSLDMPQFFTKKTYFTYRTLFWWGHYLGFALILKGENLPQIINKLKTNKARPEWSDIYLACAPTPWEWELSDDNFKKVSQMSDSEIQTIIYSIEYIKLCRFYPTGDGSFASLDWSSAAVDSYRTIISVVSEKWK